MKNKSNKKTKFIQKTLTGTEYPELNYLSAVEKKSRQEERAR